MTVKFVFVNYKDYWDRNEKYSDGDMVTYVGRLFVLCDSVWKRVA